LPRKVSELLIQLPAIYHVSPIATHLGGLVSLEGKSSLLVYCPRWMVDSPRDISAMIFWKFSALCVVRHIGIKPILALFPTLSMSTPPSLRHHLILAPSEHSSANADYSPGAESARKPQGTASKTRVCTPCTSCDHSLHSSRCCSRTWGMPSLFPVSSEPTRSPRRAFSGPKAGCRKRDMSRRCAREPRGARNAGACTRRT
jgi:hypothetical protein